MKCPRCGIDADEIYTIMSELASAIDNMVFQSGVLYPKVKHILEQTQHLRNMPRDLPVKQVDYDSGWDFMGDLGIDDEESE